MMLGELNGLNGAVTKDFKKYLKPMRILGIHKGGSAVKPISIKVATLKLQLSYITKYKQARRSPYTNIRLLKFAAKKA